MLADGCLPKELLGDILLRILHSADNNERRSVETQLVSSLSDPSTLVSLMHLLVDVPYAPLGVRQLAAVLLRKRIYTLWKFMDAATKEETKNLLLDQLGKEESKVVRFAIAHIVTRIAKAGSKGSGGTDMGWPELMHAIRVAAEDPRAAMRELSMVLLYSVTEVFSGQHALLDLAAETVVQGVMDDEEEVCRAAIKACDSLLPSLCEPPRTHRPSFLTHLLPPSLSQLKRYCTDREKVGLCVCFLDLIEDCVGELSTGSAKRKKKDLSQNALLLLEVVRTVSEILLHREVHLLIRQNCGSLLGKVVQQKPQFTLSQGLLPPLVMAAVQLMGEDASVGTLDIDFVRSNRVCGEGEEDPGNDTAAGDASDGEEEDNEKMDMIHAQKACMIGRQLLAAISLPRFRKQMTQEVMQMVELLKQQCHAAVPPSPLPLGAVPFPKKAIIFCLSSIAESHPGYLRRSVGEVVALTEQYLQDPDPITREATSASLPWFCVHLQPEILTHHQRLFPMLIPLLQDPTDRVRCQAAQALDVLCEHAAEHLDPYVHSLVHTIVTNLSSSSIPTQRNLCSVLSSIAAAKTQSFHAFAPSVLELLLQAVGMTAPNTLPLRACALETVGLVGTSMGKTAFLPYLPHFMVHVVENFKLEDPLVRQYSFGFLSNVCELLQEDFAPYVDDTICCALHTIEEDRAIYTNQHLLTKDAPKVEAFSDVLVPLPEVSTTPGGQGGGGDTRFGIEDEDASDDEEAEDSSEEEIHMRVRTADVEEKSAAVYAIGVVADVMREGLGEERAMACWQALSVLDEHFYPDIRSNALISLAKLTKALYGCTHLAGMPTTENGVPVTGSSSSPRVVDQESAEDRLSPLLRELVDDFVYANLLACVEQETEKDVVVAALEALIVLLDFFGPQCLQLGPDYVVQLCIQIMRVQLPCQRDQMEDETNEGDDSEDEAGHLPPSGDPHGGFFSVPPIAGEDGDGAPSWTTVLDPARLLEHLQLPVDHDDEVLEEAMNVLEAVFKAYKERAVPYARYVVPLLLRYADPTERPGEDVVMAVGTFACLLQFMGPAACSQYFDTAMEVVTTVKQHSEESSAISNAAYTLKVLIEHCPERFVDSQTGLLSHTLQFLWEIVSAGANPSSTSNHSAGSTPPVDPLHPSSTLHSEGVGIGVEGEASGGKREEIPEAVDNAISAAFSLVRCLPPSVLPLEMILPVLFSHIPMGVDVTENPNAVRALVHLYASPSMQPILQAQAAAPTWLPALFQATLAMLHARGVETAEKDRLAAEGVQVFRKQFPSLWPQAPAELQQLMDQLEAASISP